MLWWLWVVGGVLLLGTELTLINAEFYLLFVGASAVVTGLAIALCPACPLWAQWTLFIVLSLLSVKLFRRGLAARFRVPGLSPPGLSPVGDRVLLPEGLAAGADGRAEFRGASWAVTNRGDRAIAAGQRARVTAVEGLTLMVEADSQGE